LGQEASHTYGLTGVLLGRSELVAGDRVVVVTGAPGRQGGAVARHLLSDGWRVRAFTRKPQGKPARRLAALGAEVVGANMALPATLDVAFRDAYGVYKFRTQ
jgi:uncharacterized protein YbjT (DUF2867 family)